MFSKTNKIFFAVVFLFGLTFSTVVSAQVFGIKGGASFGTINTKEMEVKKPMINYYYELYYNQRLIKFRYACVGVGYLGHGATLSGVDLGASELPYEIKTRFNFATMPIKFKYSFEHRKKPRPYGFIGFAPAIMFNEERDYYIENFRHNGQEYIVRTYLYQWTPKRFNLFVMAGGGCYYKHFTLDISANISALRAYKENEAPISFFYGAILTIGYQVSRASNKMW